MRLQGMIVCKNKLKLLITADRKARHTVVPHHTMLLHTLSCPDAAPDAAPDAFPDAPPGACPLMPHLPQGRRLFSVLRPLRQWMQHANVTHKNTNAGLFLADGPPIRVRVRRVIGGGRVRVRVRSLPARCPIAILPHCPNGLYLLLSLPPSPSAPLSLCPVSPSSRLASPSTPLLLSCMSNAYHQLASTHIHNTIPNPPFPYP